MAKFVIKEENLSGAIDEVIRGVSGVVNDIDIGIDELKDTKDKDNIDEIRSDIEDVITRLEEASERLA